MRAFFIVIGTAATTYGLLMWAQKARRKKSASQAMTVQPSTKQVLVGPSVTSTAGSAEGPNDPVQQYDVSRALLFPPMTIVNVPGAGSLDNMDMSNMHQIVTY